MKYYYKPYTSIVFDQVEKKCALATDTSLCTKDGSTFFKYTGIALPNDIYYSNSHSLGGKSDVYKGDYALTLNGSNDAPVEVKLINGVYIAITRHQVHTSVDKQVWTSHILPSFITGMDMIYAAGKAYIIGERYFSKALQSPTIHPDLTKRLFIKPEGYKKPASQAGYDIGPYGYIAYDGWWDPKPIAYLSTMTTWLPKYDKIRISPTEINSFSTLADLNERWDPTAYNEYEYAYTGANIYDAAQYQIVCCNEGRLYYRLFSQAETSSTNDNVKLFQEINTSSTSNLYQVTLFKFIYDYDIPSQDYNTRVKFERRYVVASDGLYELVWASGVFSLILVLTGSFNDVLFVKTEYRSKWYYGNYWADYLTGLPEIHRLYLYCSGGKYIVIDASDKTTQPVIYSNDTGINFTKVFSLQYTLKDVFVTADNEFYIQDNYTSFSYKLTLTEEIIAVTAVDNDTITIHTQISTYLYNINTGLSPRIFHECFVTKMDYNSSGNVIYIESFYGEAGCISFANNKYIFENITGVYFSDNLNGENTVWTKVASNDKVELLKGNWIFFNGQYVKWYNKIFYIDLNAGEVKPGLGPDILNNETKQFVQLGQKLYLFNRPDYNFVTCYDPTIPSTGLQLPRYDLPILSPGVESYISLTSITFTMFVTKPKVRLEAIGIFSGFSIEMEVTPITGTWNGGRRYLGYPSNSSDSLISRPYYWENSWEYDQIDDTAPNNGYTPGIKTVTIAFKRVSFWANKLDLLITALSVDDINILTDVPYTISGDPWLGTNTYPLTFYRTGSNYIKNLFKAPSGLVSSANIVVQNDTVYLYTGLYNSGYENLVDVYEYNKLTGVFDTVPMGFKRTKLIQFRPIVIEGFRVVPFNNSVTYINDSVVIISTYDYCKINSQYVMSVTAKQYKQVLDNASIALGINGHFVWQNLPERYYRHTQLNPTINLLNVAQFAYVVDSVVYKRILVIGTNGYVAYTDNNALNWTEMQLGTNDLLNLIVDTKINNSTTVTYKITVVGKNGTVYYSETNGSTWQSVPVTTNLDITSVVKHSSTSKYIMSGNNFLAVSSDLLEWNTIVTTLTFNALTSVEYNNSIYIGCTEGKIIKSTDLYYWYFVVSNTANSIKKLYVAYDYFETGYFWVLNGRLIESVKPSDILTVGSSYYHNINSYPAPSQLTITDILDPYFTTNPSMANIANYATPIYTKLAWTDIYKQPAIKLYSDAACTKELINNFYTPISGGDILYFGFVNQESRTTMSFSFSSEVDVSTIRYIAIWLRKVVRGDITRQNYDGSFYTFEGNIEDTNRLSTFPVTIFDNIAKTITITGFDIPSGKKGWIEAICPSDAKIDNSTNPLAGGALGIPANSLYTRFMEDEGKCEVLYTSIWLKLTNANVMYDNLLVTSEHPYSDAFFSFKEYSNYHTYKDRSRIHNASIVSVTYNPTKDIMFKRITEEALASPYSHRLIYRSPVVENYLTDTSKMLFRGLVLDISELVVIEKENITYHSGEVDYRVEDAYQATAKLKNKYYEPDIWTYTGKAIGGGYTNASLVKSADIITLSGTVSYTPGDIAGDGYYYIRSVTADFSPLQDINADLLFDSFYIQAGVTQNQNGTDINRWVYISPTLIKIYPYFEVDQYKRVVYKPIYRQFTGSLQYVTHKTYYDYSSEALQPLYLFDAGCLEYNIDQFPAIWKDAYDLPALSNTVPLKLNLRHNCVNRGVKHLPISTIRISGVEYNL